MLLPNTENRTMFVSRRAIGLYTRNLMFAAREGDAGLLADTEAASIAERIGELFNERDGMFGAYPALIKYASDRETLLALGRQMFGSKDYLQVWKLPRFNAPELLRVCGISLAEWGRANPTFKLPPVDVVASLLSVWLSAHGKLDREVSVTNVKLYTKLFPDLEDLRGDIIRHGISEHLLRWTPPMKISTDTLVSGLIRTLPDFFLAIARQLHKAEYDEGDLQALLSTIVHYLAERLPNPRMADMMGLQEHLTNNTLVRLALLNPTDTPPFESEADATIRLGRLGNWLGGSGAQWKRVTLNEAKEMYTIRKVVHPRTHELVMLQVTHALPKTMTWFGDIIHDLQVDKELRCLLPDPQASARMADKAGQVTAFLTNGTIQDTFEQMALASTECSVFHTTLGPDELRLTPWIFATGVQINPIYQNGSVTFQVLFDGPVEEGLLHMQPQEFGVSLMGDIITTGVPIYFLAFSQTKQEGSRFPGGRQAISDLIPKDGFVSGADEFMFVPLHKPVTTVIEDGEGATSATSVTLPLAEYLGLPSHTINDMWARNFPLQAFVAEGFDILQELVRLARTRKEFYLEVGRVLNDLLLETWGPHEHRALARILHGAHKRLIDVTNMSDVRFALSALRAIHAAHLSVLGDIAAADFQAIYSGLTHTEARHLARLLAKILGG